MKVKKAIIPAAGLGIRIYLYPSDWAFFLCLFLLMK